LDECALSGRGLHVGLVDARARPSRMRQAEILKCDVAEAFVWKAAFCAGEAVNSAVACVGSNKLRGGGGKRDRWPEMWAGRLAYDRSRSRLLDTPWLPIRSESAHGQDAKFAFDVGVGSPGR